MQRFFGISTYIYIPPRFLEQTFTFCDVGGARFNDEPQMSYLTQHKEEKHQHRRSNSATKWCLTLTVNQKDPFQRLRRLWYEWSAHCPQRDDSNFFSFYVLLSTNCKLSVRYNFVLFGLTLQSERSCAKKSFFPPHRSFNMIVNVFVALFVLYFTGKCKHTHINCLESKYNFIIYYS